MSKFYRHVKTGNLYMVDDEPGFDATLDCEVVVYRPLYPCKYKVFTRTHDNFHGLTEAGVKRFEQVEIATSSDHPAR